jgi:hypothetical protein
MTLPTNDDFAIRELSVEELEAIAGGGVWGWIKHEASAAVHWAESPGLKILENIFGRAPGPKIPTYL